MKKICLLMLVICALSLGYIDSVCAEEYVEAKPGQIDEQVLIDMVYRNIYDNFGEIYPEAVIGEAEIEYKPYTDEELELLAHLIFAEAGSNWCSDKMQQYTGSVVLNRIASPLFPNNMYDVIYQKGQYSVTRTGAINKTPNERAYNVAKYLLTNGSVLPANVVFQSQHIQGDGIYEKVQNMYFCYKN